MLKAMMCFGSRGLTWGSGRVVVLKDVEGKRRVLQRKKEEEVFIGRTERSTVHRLRSHWVWMTGASNTCARYSRGLKAAGMNWRGYEG